MGQQLHTHNPSNLADILDRVLDKGVVVAGDIAISLVGVELLTIRLRLLIASVDKARDMGISWWESDPFLAGDQRALEAENKMLRERLAALESKLDRVPDLNTGVPAALTEMADDGQNSAADTDLVPSFIEPASGSSHGTAPTDAND